MEKRIDGELLNVPEHVAIIMDGNGRWATRQGKKRTAGHYRGAEVVETICEDAWNLGIKYLTVYAFSTENWKRPQAEVSTLMHLFYRYLVDYLDKFMKQNMRVRIIGDRSGLSAKINEAITNLEKKSAGNTGLNFTIAMNYGGRDEIVRAVNRLLADGVTSVDEAALQSYLDTAEIPDPNLVIRTSGEERVSNFLLWQTAYSEFYFTPVLWPDFTRSDLIDAVRAYSSRNRRYGGI